MRNTIDAQVYMLHALRISLNRQAALRAIYSRIAIYNIYMYNIYIYIYIYTGVIHVWHNRCDSCMVHVWYMNQ